MTGDEQDIPFDQQDIPTSEQPSEAEAETVPLVATAAPQAARPTPLWPLLHLPRGDWSAALRRPPRLVLVALLLAVVLAAGSGGLALAGASPFALWTGQGAARVVPSPTASPTDAPTPTVTPTVTPTAPPTATPFKGWPTGGIDLGCGSRSLNPPGYVLRSGPATKAVAITFDDGPSPDWTATDLDTLEQTHTPATFFVVGASARAYPDLIRREAADGVIAMHTWDHPFMTKLSLDARAWELAHTAQAIHADLGPNYCLPYWRPPFGDYNADVVAQARAMGLTTITWDVDPKDWSSPGVQAIVDRVLAGVHPGAIILLHDGYFHRGETAHALPQIIQGLHDRGYIPVTLPDLLAGRVPAPPPTPPADPTATPTLTPPSPTVTPTP
jgi:peptidoglycan/xylan/chitin deacetylase (PgdA/CDA1 family)